MSNKKVTIHQNEYEKLKTNKTKKPKWIQEENPLLFYTFNQKDQKSKNYKEANRKLALANMSIESLKERYDDFPDAMIHIFDLSGQTLFINKNLKDTFFLHMEELYMEPVHHQFIEYLSYDPDLQKNVKNILEQLPQKWSFEKVIRTPFGEFLMNSSYV